MDHDGEATAEDVLVDFDADDDDDDDDDDEEGEEVLLATHTNHIDGHNAEELPVVDAVDGSNSNQALPLEPLKPEPVKPSPLPLPSSTAAHPMDKPLSSSRHVNVDTNHSNSHSNRANDVNTNRNGNGKDNTSRKANVNTIVQPNNNLSSGGAAFGVYMPPFRRKQLEKEEAEAAAQTLLNSNAQTTDMSPSKTQSTPAAASAPAPAILAQRQNWEQLKKAINGTINRLNAQTIKDLIHSLFQTANLIRGKGLLAKAILRAATTSPTYAPVYASLISVINTKLPEIGELILIRSILLFRRSYARRDRGTTLSISNFIACLFNQGLCHELLCLQLLTVLLEGDPTDDSVEVAVQFTKVVGMALVESSPAGVHAVMERFRSLLHDGRIGRRVQYKIEELMKIRKNRFEDIPMMGEELDLVERDEQITFEIGLDDEGLEKEDHLDVFKFDPDWVQNEQDWTEIKREVLGDDSDDDDDGDGDGDDGSSDTDDNDDDSDEDGEDGVLVEAAPMSVANSRQITEIHDMSEKDLINLRRTIYLTIMSSATFEECSHKLSKLDIPDGKEMELINMIIECCSQERTFLRYYGMIAARFSLLHNRWSNAFHEAFIVQYNTIHRLETNKLRNVAKLFAHLLHTDSLSWSCMSVIHLNEDETTSSSRIFLKIVVQEMAEAMGIGKLVKRFETDDPENAEWFKELFPKDNPRKTRYAINFFTSIGLGPLTDGLREYLKNAPKLIMMQAEAEAAAAKLKAIKGDDSDESSVLSSSSSSSSSLSSSSSGSYTSSSTFSSDSSDESTSYSRGRRRKRSSGGRKGRRRKYSSDSSSVTTYSRSSISRSTSKKRSKRSVSCSASNSHNKGKRGSSKRKSSGSKREDISPIGSEVEIQSANRSRSRSISRSRSASPRPRSPGQNKIDLSKDNGKERKISSARKRTRSYSSSSKSRTSSDGSDTSRRGKERKGTSSRRKLQARSYSRSASRSRSKDGEKSK